MELTDLQRDPAAFRSALLIDADSGPRPFSECMDGWQAADFAALDGGWQRAAGQQVEGDCYGRAWLERARGHAKSTDVMVMATWCLFASRRQLAGVVVAVDRDQAALDRDHVSRLVSLNPWLGAVFDVQQWRIVNRHTGSTMEIMASDVASSYGLLIDFAVCDEVTLWPKRELFDSVLSAAAKRAGCLLVCVGNAGFADSWQFEAREKIRGDSDWYFSRLEGPVASWISPERLAEQGRLLPQAAYERLWLNTWSAGTGDALSASDIVAAFKPDLAPMPRKAEGWEFVGGLDLGVSRDASTICVLAVRKRTSWESERVDHGRIRLAYTKVWRPAKGRKVDLADVETRLRDLHTVYQFKRVYGDPWQAVHMLQRLRLAGLPVEELPQGGSNLQKLATVLLEAFADRRLDLYKDENLERDLRRMRVVERSYGFRLESPRDSEGHGDLGSAFQYALLAASEIGRKLTQRAGVAFGPDDTRDNLGLMEAKWRLETYQAEMQFLHEAGAGYSGREQWVEMMKQCGRYRG